MELQIERTSDTLYSLLSFIEQQEIEELDLKNESEGFKIESMDQANYFIKKVKSLRQEQEEINRIAQEQIEKYIERVNKWKEESLSPLVNQEKYYTMLLEEYAREVLKGSKKRSLKLIEGTIGFKKQPEKYEFDDELVLEQLKEKLPQYVKREEVFKFNKAEIKKNGRVQEGKFYLDDIEIEGIKVTPQDDLFSIK